MSSFITNSLSNRSTTLLTVLLCLYASGAMAQQLLRTEAQTKALYTKSIAEYTTWPTPADQGTAENGTEVEPTPFVIGIVGDDPNKVIEPIRTSINSPKGLSIGGRTVRLLMFPSVFANAKRSKVQAALDECHLLFFSTDSQDAWQKLKPMLLNRPIMTVGEIQGFARQGGIVEYEFDRSAKKMYMIFNLQAMKDAGLVINARLLDLDISKPLFAASEQ
jgi:hypothetical protein